MQCNCCEQAVDCIITLQKDCELYLAENCFETDLNFCSKMILVSVLVLVFFRLTRTNSHLWYFFSVFYKDLGQTWTASGIVRQYPSGRFRSDGFIKQFLGGERSISDSESLWSHFFLIMIGLYKFLKNQSEREFAFQPIRERIISKTFLCL